MSAPDSSSRAVTCDVQKILEIPAGWFLMGSESGQDNERPVHRVWVDAFCMGATQVTNAQYAMYLKATGDAAPPTWRQAAFDELHQPVVSVSWFDAVAYCDWYGRISGRTYRLPTEAEWERAARAGMEGKLYAWGNDGPETLPDYEVRWVTGPEPVARYAPNGFGLYNMGDNVHEWCSDWYDATYYGASPERNPRGPAEGTRRVSRGGSWRHHVKVARCAARSSIPPHFKYADYGFRIAGDVLR